MDMLALVASVVGALVLGADLGWASRRHAHWCPACGDRLTCGSCRQAAHERSRAQVYPLGPGLSGPGGPL
jgi:hypothetical protein